MKIYWNKYKEYGLDEPKLSPNRKIMNINLSNLFRYLGNNQIDS